LRAFHNSSVQLKLSQFFCTPQPSKFFATSQLSHNLSHCKSSQIASVAIGSSSPKKETFQNFRVSPSRAHFYTETKTPT